MIYNLQVLSYSIYNLQQQKFWQNLQSTFRPQDDEKNQVNGIQPGRLMMVYLKKTKNNIFCDKFLCCLYMCIFNAFLVLVTYTTNIIRGCRTSMLGLSMVLHVPLFVLSYWHSARYQTPLRLSLDILLSMINVTRVWNFLWIFFSDKG
jgi:hypothetical protein